MSRSALFTRSPSPVEATAEGGHLRQPADRAGTVNRLSGATQWSYFGPAVGAGGRPRPAGLSRYRAPQMTAASAIVRSLARSCSRVIRFPPTEVANPHRGERASRSVGTNRAAPSIRAESSSTVSIRSEDLRDVAEERLQGVVRGGGAVRVPEVREQARAREGDLHDPIRPASRIRELLRREEPLAPELSTTAIGGRSILMSSSSSLRHVPHRNASRSQSANPSTASTSWLWKDRCRISPSVTTSRPLSSCRRSASSTARSSTRLNPSRGELVPSEAFARLEELRRAEQAPDDVGTRLERAGHPHLLTRRYLPVSEKCM